MPDIVIREFVVEGDVDLSPAQRLAAGSDLDFVASVLDLVDPIDVDSDDPSATEYAIHRVLNYVRAEITRRRAVQAGSGPVVDYCGVSDEHGRACGPSLGLPDCRQHATCGVCGHDATSGGLWWFRDHRTGGCPDATPAIGGRADR
jgi:hypothetical protein